ncbi:MAG: TA system VapC family ribonuclease toxin [Acidobacteriota bacterium]
MIAVDTNILVYAHRREFPQHARALAAVSGLADGADLWAIPVVCISEFLRVTTHPGILKPPSTVEQATQAIAALQASPSLRVLMPGERHIALLLQLTRDRGVTGNLTFDAQIVALCVEHGVRELLTADRDFQRFPDITVRAL